MSSNVRRARGLDIVYIVAKQGRFDQAESVTMLVYSVASSESTREGRCREPWLRDDMLRRNNMVRCRLSTRHRLLLVRIQILIPRNHPIKGMKHGIHSDSTPAEGNCMNSDWYRFMHVCTYHELPSQVRQATSILVGDAVDLARRIADPFF